MTARIDLLISFMAGLFSFLTPCVLPLVPTYLSLIGGLTLSDIRNANYKKSKLVVRALFFIAGFTIVFVLMGIFLWGAFHLAGPLESALTVVAGSVVILLGLDILFDFLPFLKREKRFNLNGRPIALIGVFAFGMALGAGWSPCIGPLLGGIIALTAAGTSLWGVANLASYSLGLGLPFIVLALAFLPLSAYLEKVKKHFTALKIASGVFLIFIGVLIILGRLTGVSAIAYRAGFLLAQAYRSNPWAWRTAFSAFYFAFGALPLGVRLTGRRKKDAENQSAVPVGRIVFLCLMSALAVLEMTGVIQSALFLSAWFQAGELSPF